jgi:hypothetical protein
VRTFVASFVLGFVDKVNDKARDKEGSPAQSNWRPAAASGLLV